jgi:hypothetical protein
MKFHLKLFLNYCWDLCVVTKRESETRRFTFILCGRERQRDGGGIGDVAFAGGCDLRCMAIELRVYAAYISHFGGKKNGCSLIR